MTASTLERVSAIAFDDYSPALVADVVNDLRPLGLEESLQRMRAAGALVSQPPDATGLLWVARVLFDMPPGTAFPPVRLGSPDVTSPSDPTRLPRFPIVIYRDIPFLVVRGYALGGLPERLDDHLAFYGEHGQVRSAPLSPARRSPDLRPTFMSVWEAAYDGEPAPDITDIVAAQIERLRD